MLAARAVLAGSTRPPVVLVHGAANSAGVWRFWQEALAARGWSSWALDLRGHGASRPCDLGTVSMADYVADVRALVGELARPPVLIGWSMGGLVAMLAAARGGVVAYVGLAPSPPAAAPDPAAPVREGTFDAAEYGISSLDPGVQPTMPDLDRAERAVALGSLAPESRRARDERKAGVLAPRLPCPALVVSSRGDATFPPATYESLAVPADRLVVDGASHWGLVLSRRLLATLVLAVTRWLDRQAPGAAAPRVAADA